VTRLYIDTEVKAPFPKALKKLGLHNYARHPDTRLLLTSYAIDDGPETVVDNYHGELFNREFCDASADPNVVKVAHHAQFDRVVLMHKGLYIPREQWYCTMARAMIHGLPGKLDKLSQIYKLGDDAKKDGHDLIMLFCEQAADPDQHLVEWFKFIEYSSFDITALRRLDRELPNWCFGPHEQRIYHLTQKINDCGFKVDLPLAMRMIEASSQATASLNAKVQRLTDNLIQKGTQGKKIKEWLNSESEHEFDNLKAETLRKAVRDHKAGAIVLDPDQLEMIELRLLAAKSSISKCKTALAQAGDDGRVRYAKTYAGGGRIGRFSHKGFQPGNMPRPSQKFKKMVPTIIEALGARMAYDVWGDETVAACSDAIRGLIVAEEGKKIVVADWSNIEGRWLAWMLGEQWKLQAYRDQDAGIGEDGYKLLFHRMTGIPLELIDDFLRQQGKGVDLSMGYEGGVGAFLNIANSYQIDLVMLADAAPRTLPAEFMERGRSSWAWAVKHGATHDLPEKIYVACAALRDSYRAACPNIKAGWGHLLDCAKLAVQSPGKLFTTAGGKVAMATSTGGEWLSMRIPSGRQIMFAKPKIELTRRVWRDEDGDLVEDEGKPSLTALKAPMWVRRPLYGGMLANAATQGGCRDILTNGLLAVDEEITPLGGNIILDVHDEIDAELPDEAAYDHEDLIRTMTTDLLARLPWLAGMPLVAAGATLKRYKKL
jgi:DNA polymerase